MEIKKLALVIIIVVEVTSNYVSASTTVNPANNSSLEDDNSTTAGSETIHSPDETLLPNNKSSGDPPKNPSKTLSDNTTVIPASTKSPSVTVHVLSPNATESLKPELNQSTSTTESTAKGDQEDSDSETTSEKPKSDISKLNSTTVSAVDTTQALQNETKDATTTQPKGISSTEKARIPKPTYPSKHFDINWMHIFLMTHHFEGVYFYDGGKYLFDFVARNVHPLSTTTLVAFFYDEDGAILEMNGTSVDGLEIKFVKSKIFTAGYRFPVDMDFELIGALLIKEGRISYNGNFTKPLNSSFETFQMRDGAGVVETGDAAGTRTAIIVIIPVSIAFLGVIGTVTVLCWASKKGLLRGRHRSYQLFKDTPVAFESEAETIHI